MVRFSTSAGSNPAFRESDFAAYLVVPRSAGIVRFVWCCPTREKDKDGNDIGPTTGDQVTTDSKGKPLNVYIISGVKLPGMNHKMPKGSGNGKLIPIPGENGPVDTDIESRVNSALDHAEGHAVANMIDCKKTDSTIHVNHKEGPCNLCKETLPHLLPKGHKLKLCRVDKDCNNKCYTITGVK